MHGEKRVWRITHNESVGLGVGSRGPGKGGCEVKRH